MVRDYLLRTQPDRDFQIGVIEEAMSNFHRYFFIMPTLARFELELHERAERGQPLTADSFNNLMADLFSEGYGDDLEMDRLRTGSTWAQFSTHLYSNFYVYQYATGIAGAHALARGILDKKGGVGGSLPGLLACWRARAIRWMRWRRRGWICVRRSRWRLRLGSWRSMWSGWRSWCLNLDS